MLDYSRPCTHHQGLPFGLTASCVSDWLLTQNCWKALIQGREGHENQVVYQVRQEDRFHSSLPSQSRSVSSGLTWRDIVVPREGMGAGAPPAPFFCLLPFRVTEEEPEVSPWETFLGQWRIRSDSFPLSPRHGGLCWLPLEWEHLDEVMWLVQLDGWVLNFSKEKGKATLEVFSW